MLSIDEAIAKYKEKARFLKQTTNIAYSLEFEQIAEWLEELKAIKSDEFTDDLLDMGFTKGYSKALEELKVIKEMDLSIPQHFTKEQSDWIKKYCINRNKEFYNKALDDFAERLKAEYVKHYVDGDPYFDYIDEIAEQLKEQNNG